MCSNGNVIVIRECHKVDIDIFSVTFTLPLAFQFFCLLCIALNDNGIIAAVTLFKSGKVFLSLFTIFGLHKARKFISVHDNPVILGIRLVDIFLD